MSTIPRKVNERGGALMDRIISTSNETIDYLKASRLHGDNKTILVNESTAGTTISAISSAKSTSKPSKAVKQERNLTVPFAYNHVYAYDGPPVSSSIVDTRGSEIGEMNRFSYTDRTDLTTSTLEFGFSTMDVCINGFYGRVFGTGLYRTLSGTTPPPLPPSSTWGYSLEELMQPVISADQYYHDRNGQWMPLVDDACLIGTLRLRTKLMFLSGNVDYPTQDYSFDPIWGVWKVTHELGPTRARLYNDYFSDNTTPWNPGDMSIVDADSVSPSYFNYLAEYMVYDFNNWLEEYREKGSSTQTVKFRWRQLDFYPSLMIPVNNYIRNELWEHQYEQEHSNG